MERTICHVHNQHNRAGPLTFLTQTYKGKGEGKIVPRLCLMKTFEIASTWASSSEQAFSALALSLIAIAKSFVRLRE
jgi:hypothetical protein